MATSYSTLVLPDGAKLAYEVLGSPHLERSQPIILIGGMSSTRVDFERLTQCLIKSYPGLTPLNISSFSASNLRSISSHLRS